MVLAGGGAYLRVQVDRQRLRYTRDAEASRVCEECSGGDLRGVCMSWGRLRGWVFVRFCVQGYKGCAVVLGGVDVKGSHIYKVHPHGSTDCCNFAAMGSGSLSAMAVLEAGPTHPSARTDSPQRVLSVPLRNPHTHAHLAIGRIQAGVDTRTTHVHDGCVAVNATYLCMHTYVYEGFGVL